MNESKLLSYGFLAGWKACNLTRYSVVTLGAESIFGLTYASRKCQLNLDERFLKNGDLRKKVTHENCIVVFNYVIVLQCKDLEHQNPFAGFGDLSLRKNDNRKAQNEYYSRSSATLTMSKRNTNTNTILISIYKNILDSTRK